ncbi:helix-turn-helix domain-containing protein [Bacillus sp. Marseille-P3800]|uniref:helix-turn-helix domain-containing protein n=1 Tax=Bacillus sp. Marseille-P3800 TaxID=2014782 RepID=UPI000C0774E9|nr:helix-turn-helix transcriptional regulator [Bacillus sp. Marseille-P3800]
MEHFLHLRLKQLRKKHKIPQKRLAEKLGIQPRSYRFYESGGRYPDFEGLLKLANFYHVSLDYLVGWSNDESINKKTL